MTLISRAPNNRPLVTPLTFTLLDLSKMSPQLLFMHGHVYRLAELLLQQLLKMLMMWNWSKCRNYRAYIWIGLVWSSHLYFHFDSGLRNWAAYHMCEKFKTCSFFSFIPAQCFLFSCFIKQHFFGLIPVAEPVIEKTFPCWLRREGWTSPSFLGLENIFMLLLHFSSPNTFPFICFRKVEANSSSLSCILHLGF